MKLIYTASILLAGLFAANKTDAQKKSAIPQTPVWQQMINYGDSGVPDPHPQRKGDSLHYKLMVRKQGDTMALFVVNQDEVSNGILLWGGKSLSPDPDNKFYPDIRLSSNDTVYYFKSSGHMQGERPISIFMEKYNRTRHGAAIRWER